MAAHGDNESGVLVYPQLPVPRPRRDEPRLSTHRERRRRRLPIITIVLSAIAGGAGVWFVQPMIAPDPRIGAADKRASDAEAAAVAQKSRADTLDKSLEAAARSRRDTEVKLAAAEGAEAELASKIANEAGARKAAETVQAKLKPVAATAGALVVDGNDVHLRITDRVLFKSNDDALSDRGKIVLGRLAAALKELPDRQVWVQGHTDDTPLALPKPPPPPPKGSKAPPPPAPVVRFPTNWELSGARALAVVRYLQDAGKVDPSQLTAAAFGQYAPISKKDRAANRRIEIVVTARRPIKPDTPAK
ncbi:MAG TPA: OmpA family protein [Kofleriaceae bacterium]|jgi:chemotaxis protein MotB|nr:OmpA family protein [Kofleriaceae bacterium]